MKTLYLFLIGFNTFLAAVNIINGQFALLPINALAIFFSLKASSEV
jgi:hypothetical protein